MSNHDIIENKTKKLVDHLSQILGSSKRARFAVGYLFLSEIVQWRAYPLLFLELKWEVILMKIRTAVITGGAQGIGKAMAQRFLKDGFAVVIADVDEDAGRETAAERQN